MYRESQKSKTLTLVAAWVTAIFFLNPISGVLAQLPGGHFTEPEQVPANIAPGSGEIPRVSADGLELYFTDFVLGDIYVARRNHVDEEFGDGARLDSPINDVAWETMNSISADGLEMYFHRSPTGEEDADMYVATRPSRADKFSNERLLALNEPNADECCAFLSPDGLTFYYTSDRAGGAGWYDLYKATRGTTDQEFGNVVAMSEINSAGGEVLPFLSSDGLILLFTDFFSRTTRPDRVGRTDMFFATRSNVDEPFSNITNLGEPINNRDVNDQSGALSPDWPAAGSTIYFFRGTGTAASRRLFRANWVPELAGDFSGRGTLDVADIDLLTTKVREGRNPASFDLNGDKSVNGEDRRVWVEQIRKTYFGDANLDGEFNSGDFVQVFQGGLYETGQDAGWGSGDWNGDGHFESGDFVTVFQAGGYEKGPRAALVPEPAGLSILGIGLLLGLVRRRR